MRTPVLLAMVFACDHEPAAQRAAPTPISTELTGACFEIVVDMVADGLWVNAPGGLRCYAPRAAGQYDVAWLARELRGLQARVPAKCAPNGKIRGDAGIPVEDFSAVTDAFSEVGMMDFRYEARRGPLNATVLPPRSCTTAP